MQQRYYDPQVGRFLTVDPVTPASKDGLNFNRYKYAANNPYRYTDPDGRCESIGTCQMERDDMDLAEGRMTPQEHAERIDARGAGAIGGLVLVGAGYVAVQAAPVAVAVTKATVKAATSKFARSLLCAVFSICNPEGVKGTWARQAKEIAEALRRLEENAQKVEKVAPPPPPPPPPPPTPPPPLVPPPPG